MQLEKDIWWKDEKWVNRKEERRMVCSIIGDIWVLQRKWGKQGRKFCEVG